MAKRKRKAALLTTCPCGSGNTPESCCGPYLSGEAVAPTAEQLMRSRYSAYVARNEMHLLRTWHMDTRPPSVAFNPAQEWTGLEIVHTESGGRLDTTGVVSFVARWTDADGPGQLEERSRFTRVDGAWMYLDGKLG